MKQLPRVIDTLTPKSDWHLISPYKIREMIIYKILRARPLADLSWVRVAQGFIISRK